MSNQKLIFDIETAGTDFNALDAQSQQYIINNLSSEEDKLLAKEQLGFYPTTGIIAVIGVLNPETNKGAMFINNASQHPDLPKNLEEGIEIISGTEKEILEKFWQTIEKYNYFISFNGRGFDVPFLMIRSLAHEIRPTKNLWASRYLTSQKYDALHIDLFDQLTGYGASRFKYSSLHFFSKLINAPSPKEGELTGENVSQAFKEGKVLDIAKYNLGDLYATKALYEKWNKYLNI